MNVKLPTPGARTTKCQVDLPRTFGECQCSGVLLSFVLRVRPTLPPQAPAKPLAPPFQPPPTHPRLPLREDESLPRVAEDRKPLL